MAKLNVNKIQMAGPQPTFGSIDTMLMPIGEDKYAAMITAIDNNRMEWTDPLLDEEQYLTVIGTDQYGYEHKFVNWGETNLMPVEIANKVGSDETVNSSLESLKRICYGGGVHLCTVDHKQDDPSAMEALERAEDWADNTDLQMQTLKQAKNYKTWAWNLDVIILNALGTEITDVYTREVEDVRLAPRNKKDIYVGTLQRPAGMVPFAYYGKFNQYKNLTLENVETIALLDERTPLKDLRVLMGLERDPKTGQYRCDNPGMPAGYSGFNQRNEPTCKLRKFGILRRMPTTEKRVYPIPPYAAIIKGNWLDIKQSIELSLKAKIKNNTQIKYLVTIHPQYWMAKLNQEGVTGGLNSVEGKECQKKYMQEIIDNLCGASNQNKPLITGQVPNPMTQEMADMIKVTTIDNKKQGGDWADDITEATNMICYGMGIHPSLVGAVPGKSGNNNSGSDKREMYTIAQANETSTRDIMLLTYRVILKYNGLWKEGVRCSFPFLQLTTLDEHQSAKQVQPKTNEE